MTMPRNRIRELRTIRAGDSGNDGKYDGISGELDRIKVLGNAVVPQLAELLGRALIAWDKQ